MRHRENFLKNPRGLPQFRHRLYLRTLNFGFLACFARMAEVAKVVLPLSIQSLRNGNPRRVRRFLASSSERAVVTIETFSPRTRSTFW